MHMRDQRIIPFPPALIEALKSARRIVPDGVQALAIALEYETEENLLMNVGKSNPVSYTHLRAHETAS